MSTDLFSNILFNDGEGLTHGDLNAAVQLPWARSMDQLIQPSFGDIRFDPTQTVPDTNNSLDLGTENITYARTASEGCAVIRTTGLTVLSIGAGTIFQKTAASAGLLPSVLSYSIPTAGQALGTPAAAHATLHRVDLIQVKLELVDGGSESRDFKDSTTGALSTTTPNKSKRVQATFSLKTGTNSAFPVTIPAPDAGYCILGMVFIPGGWNSANTMNLDGRHPSVGDAVLMQASIPLGIRGYTVYPQQFQYGGATNWALNADGTATATGAGTTLIARCPVETGRIVAIAIDGSLVASANIELRGGPSAPICDVLVSTPLAASRRWHTPYLYNGTDGASLTVVAARTFPLWAIAGVSGPVLRPQNRADVTMPDRSYVDIDAGSTSKIRAVTFFVAG